MEDCSEDDIRLIEEMGAGTIVIWENLDRIIEPKKRHKNGEDDFYAVASRVKRHLEMVFHRYLETGKLKIIFNGIEVVAWDPFLRGETATQPLPEEDLENGSSPIYYLIDQKLKKTPGLIMKAEAAGIRYRDSISTGTNAYC